MCISTNMHSPGHKRGKNTYSRSFIKLCINISIDSYEIKEKTSLFRLPKSEGHSAAFFTSVKTFIHFNQDLSPSTSVRGIPSFHLKKHLSSLQAIRYAVLYSNLKSKGQNELLGITTQF